MKISLRDILAGAVLGALVYVCAVRRQGRRFSALAALGTALLAASMAAVFSVTGVSPISGFHADIRLDSANLIPFAGIKAVSHGGFTGYAVRNIVGNILLFLPLGFLTPALFSRWSGLLRVALLGFGASLLIECTQLFLMRGTDVDDLLLNTVGAVLGFGLHRLAALLRRPGADRRLGGVLPAVGCVLLPYMAVILFGFYDRALYLAL